MKDRLLEFLRAENKSSAQFAEEIGVQPSGISHILSGRNNPSLDFILKMLEKYKFLSTDWLLFGKGSMYKDGKVQSLFDEESVTVYNTSEKPIQVDPAVNAGDRTEQAGKKSDSEVAAFQKDSRSSIVRIIWFYDNNSFEEYFPQK
jgi:transcriptional regulator with XRE-family HTH domain